MNTINCSVQSFYSRSFSSPTRCKGFADRPPVDSKLLMQLLCHGELPTPSRFRFMVSLPRVQLTSLCAVRIMLNSAIFLYTTGPATFCHLTAALDSSCSVQGGGYFIELCNASCFYALQRINYFYPDANVVLSHGTRDCGSTLAIIQLECNYNSTIFDK